MRKVNEVCMYLEFANSRAASEQLLSILTIKKAHHQWIVNKSRPQGEGLPIPEMN